MVQLPHGEFIEIHEPLIEYDRYRLVSFESPVYQPATPDEDGKIGGKEKTRGALSRLFFHDRVAPVTPRELEAAQHHHELESGEKH